VVDPKPTAAASLRYSNATLGRQRRRDGYSGRSLTTAGHRRNSCDSIVVATPGSARTIRPPPHCRVRYDLEEDAPT
jgi:hypothetical protein